MKKFRLYFEGEEQEELFDSYEEAEDYARDLLSIYSDNPEDFDDMLDPCLDAEDFDCEIYEED